MFFTKLKEPCSFQMAPVLSFLISSGSIKKEPRCICLSGAKVSLRLKILMTFGSKKGTQIYFLFSPKPRKTNPLQVPQQGHYEREARPQGTLHISQKNLSSRVPCEGAPPLRAP
jgi:hypothetical protein